MEKPKKILIIGNSHLVVFGFRGELIERLVSEKFDVTVCFPNGPFGNGDETAKEYGCNFIEAKIDRRGTNPIRDLSLIRQYYKIIRKLKPDIVLSYTVKPDVYGGIVCRILKVPFVPNITGLGKGLDSSGIVQRITILMYKLAVKKAKCVFFQNESDKLFFDNKKIKYPKGIIIPGSGVNLDKFIPLAYPADNDKIRFTYIARVMKAKGIEQFFDAAHAIKQKYPNVELHICGFCEEDYKQILDEKIKSGEIIYHGLVDNVLEHIESSHCIVLPSFHPEGISNVLLEAAACARPIITTDHVGCKEVVSDGKTGYIVKQKDSDDLIEKMIKFIETPHSLKNQMGCEGRKKVEAEFDRQIVVNNYVNVIRSEDSL